jgi:GT2 family glycosyltransferase
VTGPLEVQRLNSPTAIAARGVWIAAQGLPQFAGVLPFASSCNLGIHRTAFARIGGFDETARAGEDILLSLELWRHGLELGYNPDAIVHYRYATDAASLWRQALRNGRSQPRLWEQLRAEGMVEGVHVHWRNWAWLLRHAVDVRASAGRLSLAWVLGHKVGNVWGSIERRVLYV